MSGRVRSPRTQSTPGLSCFRLDNTRPVAAAHEVLHDVAADEPGPPYDQTFPLLGPSFRIHLAHSFQEQISKSQTSDHSHFRGAIGAFIEDWPTRTTGKPSRALELLHTNPRRSVHGIQG